MKFTKMHGCGNDYIYVNGFVEKIIEKEKPEIVRKLSDRHFGVGSDGVIFINPSEEADFEMEMYNADGSRAEMCGNGIRCVAKYAYDKGLTKKQKISIISAGAIKYLEMTVENEKVSKVRVNMGRPILEGNMIPVLDSDGKETNESIINDLIKVNEREFQITCVSMGNPHAVVFLPNVKDFCIEEWGPFFENHKRFPKRINTEFVRILDKSTVEMRVWERGAGETLACGTGCCATAVACVLNGLTNDFLTVKLIGGELEIEWDRETGFIYMTGPAETVFEGEIN